MNPRSLVLIALPLTLACQIATAAQTPEVLHQESIGPAQEITATLYRTGEEHGIRFVNETRSEIALSHLDTGLKYYLQPQSSLSASCGDIEGQMEARVEIDGTPYSGFLDVLCGNALIFRGQE